MRESARHDTEESESPSFPHTHEVQARSVQEVRVYDPRFSQHPLPTSVEKLSSPTMEIPIGFAFASFLKCLGHNKKSFWYPILEEDIPMEDSGISDKKSDELRKLAQMGIFCQTVIELSVYVAMLVSIGLLKEVSRKTV